MKKMRNSFVLASVLFISSTVNADSLSENDLPRIVATRGESVAFVRDFKGKDINVKGTLYQIHKQNNKIYLAIKSYPEPVSKSNNSLLTICPMSEKESKKYDSIRKDDPITLNGSISNVGIWYSNRLVTKLSEGCKVQKQ